MAEFPILKWLTVDGQSVPFTYPQHKKSDGSYVETGEDNPLPVANYGMTEGGVWIPQRVNDDGSVNTQITGSNVEKLKEYIDTHLVDYDGELTTQWLYFGDNKVNGPTGLWPLDVSEFSEVSIYLENNYNHHLSSIRVYGMKENNIRGRDGNLLYQFSVDNLEEGESVYITKEEFDDLKKPIMGLGIRYAGNTDIITEGYCQVVFYGKRRG